MSHPNPKRERGVDRPSLTQRVGMKATSQFTFGDRPSIDTFNMFNYRRLPDPNIYD
ncbi:MAG: hypothetical protein LW870_16740 [Pirellula sp.]|nr:hypothetical protein [Pirellula sp.]